MADLFFNPYAWLVGAILISCAEILIPGFLFLGFGLAAFAIGILLFLFGSLLSQWDLGAHITLAVFGALSVLSWWLLRKVLGVRQRQETLFHDDINETD